MNWTPSPVRLPQLCSELERNSYLLSLITGLAFAGGDACSKEALVIFRREFSTSNANRTSAKTTGLVAPNGTSTATRKENPENRVMHALSKPLHLDNALRYKVKMWMFRNACTRPQVASSGPATSVATGASESSGGSEGHVGYCMMTMIIRNGLQQLVHGRHAFVEHALLVTRHHCLPQRQAARVVEFAQAWYDWAHMHAPELIRQLRAGSHLLASACYLMHAERFAKAFTQTLLIGAEAAGRTAAIQNACKPCMKRPMRGILVLVGFEGDAVAKIAELTGGKVTDAAGLPWSPALPTMGTVLALTPLLGTVRSP
jgi:hypothetical protein